MVYFSSRKTGSDTCRGESAKNNNDNPISDHSSRRSSLYIVYVWDFVINMTRMFDTRIRHGKYISQYRIRDRTVYIYMEKRSNFLIRRDFDESNIKGI